MPKTAFVVVVAVSVFGIAVSVVFLYFNMHFRKKKVVKLSSPRLNNVAVWGCVVVYCSVILHGLDHSTVESEESFSRLCTVNLKKNHKYELSENFISDKSLFTFRWIFSGFRIDVREDLQSQQNIHARFSKKQVASG